MNLREIEQLADEIMHLKSSQTLDPEIERRVNEIQDDYQTDLDLIRGKNARRDFYLQYLDEAKREWQKQGGERDRPLCTCPSPSCDIKDARLPPECRDNIDKGIVELRQSHRGRPLVLDDARQELLETIASVKSRMREVIWILRHNSLPENIETTEKDKSETAET